MTKLLHNPHNASIPTKKYIRMSTDIVTFVPRVPILAASVINNSMIESVGQEIGQSYGFSSDIDSNTGKTFSHEWESGN